MEFIEFQLFHMNLYIMYMQQNRIDINLQYKVTVTNNIGLDNSLST